MRGLRKVGRRAEKHYDSRMVEPLGDLPKTATVLEEGIADGLHIGAQAYVSLGGRVRAENGRRVWPLTESFR